MSDPFTRDGRLSISTLRQLGAVAEGARRHIAGSGNFYTAALGATHLDASPTAPASTSVFIQVLSADAQQVKLADGSKLLALPAQQFALQDDGTSRGVAAFVPGQLPDAQCWFIGPNNEMPALYTMIAVEQAGADENGVPIFAVHLPAAVVQITGPLDKFGNLKTQQVTVYGTKDKTVDVYQAQAAVIVNESITGVLPCYAYLPPFVNSAEHIADQQPQYLNYYIAVLVGRAHGQANSDGTEAPPIAIYAFLPPVLNAVILQTQGVAQSDGSLKPQKVPLKGFNSQVDVYPSQAGILGPGGMSPAVDCYAFSLQATEVPQKDYYYLGILIGRSDETPSLNIYGIRVGVQLTTAPPPFPPFPPTSPPPIIFGPAYPPIIIPIFGPVPPGWPPEDPPPPPWPEPTYLVWIAAFNLYQPIEFAYPLQTLVADNTGDATAHFGRIIFTAAAPGCIVIDWQGFNLYDGTNWIGPGCDLWLQNSHNVTWNFGFNAQGLLQAKPVASLESDADFLPEDFSLSKAWQTVANIVLHLQPGRWHVTAQLNAHILPYNVGDYISARLYDGSLNPGCPIKFCYALCVGSDFVDAAPLTWIYECEKNVELRLQATIVLGPRGMAGTTGELLGCTETAGTTLAATRIGD